MPDLPSEGSLNGQVVRYAAWATAKHHGHTQTRQMGTLGVPAEITEGRGNTLKATSWMFSEAATYQMLLWGHAPASEPFRKWVTEEVLPSIRKTGAYNVNESTTVEGQQFAGELTRRATGRRFGTLRHFVPNDPVSQNLMLPMAEVHGVDRRR
ncbi:hypothetical protein DN824_09590 [Stutzerimonas nosocomialis]|uniref:BRO family protein n=1 Tax=Stutzerimonas nosocomialis TaxID=1056496 RepID=UPI001109916D|nr:hypothetical protein DN824_09590 [Stutzerimonas nosocomialis]